MTFGILLVFFSIAAAAKAVDMTEAMGVEKDVDIMDLDVPVDVDSIMSFPFPSFESKAFSDTSTSENRNFLSATLGSNMVLQRDKPAMMGLP